MDSVTFSQIVDKLGEVMKPVFDKAGEVANFVGTAYYKQAIVVGVQSLIYAVLAIIGVAVAWAVMKHAWKWATPRIEAEAAKHVDDRCWSMIEVMEWWIRLATIICFLIIVGQAAFVIPTQLTDGVGHLINPEYYTIQSLLDTVKQ